MKNKTNNNQEKIEGPWTIVFHRLVKKKLVIAGLIIFTILVLSAALAPYLTPYYMTDMDFTAVNQPPSGDHILGTDEIGRDYLTMLLFGGRISLQVGLFAVVIQIILGLLVGGVSGYYGGKIDMLLMRFTEVIMSFPFLPLAITLSAIIGTSVPADQKMYITMAIIGLLNWPSLSRMIRGQILSLREEEFMMAAKALGLSDARKIIKHLLPNTVGYVIVSATVGIGNAILTESALSFLGMGVTPPTPSWGSLVTYAREAYTFSNRLWLWIPPGLCIFLAVMSINFIGDGLRDAIDPKSK